MVLVTLTFDLLTLKPVCKSQQRWGTFVPNLGTLGLQVLELFAMYATDGQQTDRQTDGQKQSLLSHFLRRGHNKFTRRLQGSVYLSIYLSKKWRLGQRKYTETRQGRLTMWIKVLQPPEYRNECELCVVVSCLQEVKAILKNLFTTKNCKSTFREITLVNRCWLICCPNYSNLLNNFINQTSGRNSKQYKTTNN